MLSGAPGVRPGSRRRGPVVLDPAVDQLRVDLGGHKESLRVADPQVADLAAKFVAEEGGGQPAVAVLSPVALRISVTRRARLGHRPLPASLRPDPGPAIWTWPGSELVDACLRDGRAVRRSCRRLTPASGWACRSPAGPRVPQVPPQTEGRSDGHDSRARLRRAGSGDTFAGRLRTHGRRHSSSGPQLRGHPRTPSERVERWPRPSRQPLRLPSAADSTSYGLIGPAEEGGYDLLALRGPRPELFTGVAWSTPSVRAQTLSRAAAAFLSVRGSSRRSGT